MTLGKIINGFLFWGPLVWIGFNYDWKLSVALLILLFSVEAQRQLIYYEKYQHVLELWKEKNKEL